MATAAAAAIVDSVIELARSSDRSTFVFGRCSSIMRSKNPPVFAGLAIVVAILEQNGAHR